MIPCLSCKANCCKHYDVFIDHEDVLNLSIKVGNFSFIKKMEYKKSFGYVPRFKLYENGKKKSWVLCLNNPNRVCTFLKNDICTVYDKRPLICKNYPFTYEDNKVRIVKNLCPVKWKLNNEMKEEIENNYKRLLLNFLTFETICSNWNKIVRREDDIEKFLTFIINYKLNDTK